MGPTKKKNKKLPKKSLSTILKEQPCLYDLHAHLLGMGNAGFWIDTILMDDTIMPTNKTFKKNKNTREAYCPLVWDEKSGGFVNGKETARFFYYLVQNNIFRKANGETSELISFEKEIKSLIAEKYPQVLINLLKQEFYEDLIHGGLQFKEDFSYDVVLELSHLGHGLGIKHSDCEGFVQLAVIEKLGCHLLPNRETKFQHWITFNVKEQKFKIVYGIQVGQLRKLIDVDQNNPSEAARLARAHIINAFSMCDAEGTRARHIDLHSFHGSFTPEFYPRRFALKDSIYSQRLDILAALIAHIIERYQTCLPPVKYCEFSVSVNDLSQAWIFDVLRSVQIYCQDSIQKSREGSKQPIYKADENLSSFSQFVLNKHFPYLRRAYMGPTITAGESVQSNLPSVTYKFLAGFDRRKIAQPFPVEPEKALNFLYVTPHEAILLMMGEIEKSKNARHGKENETDIGESASNGQVIREEAFDPCIKKLERLDECAKEITWFHEWIVGLDLFGDELGYPYCPFVARPFINFVLRLREKNPFFGLRIHCGENVKFAKDDNPAYRLFVAHMYIVFSSLLFLQEELGYGIRIGHGIAFDHILGPGSKSAKNRKSSVLMADMRNNAFSLFQKIAFEVNITSNEYLLGQTLRQGDYKQILRLRQLFSMEAQITLGTDDDGIWPIDQCSSVHPGHHSLAAEYCRAVSTSMVDSPKTLNQIFRTTKKVCFWGMKNSEQQSMIEKAKEAKEAEEAEVNSSGDLGLYKLVVHPDIIKRILKKYDSRLTPLTIPSALKKHSKISDKFPSDYEWKKNLDGKLRVAFVCICAKSNNHDEEQIREQYNNLFGPSHGTNEEFDFIYRNWSGVVSSFVRLEPSTELKIIIEGNRTGRGNTMIHAVDPRAVNPLNFLEEHLSERDRDILQAQNGNLSTEIDIRAYAPKFDMKILATVIERYRSASERENGTGILHLYTNTNKYLYTYIKVGKQLKCSLNPTPSRRAMEDENFLYVICQHAGAATAAVHLISEQLSTLTNTVNSPSAPDSTLFGCAAPLATPNINNIQVAPQSPAPPVQESPPDILSLNLPENPSTFNTSENKSRVDEKRALPDDDSGNDNNRERAPEQPNRSEPGTQINSLTQPNRAST